MQLYVILLWLASLIWECCFSLDITNTSPPYGTCLCLTESSVAIRASACGTVLGLGDIGTCFTYGGSHENCSLSGVPYEFFQIRYQSQYGWIAGNYLNVSSTSLCPGNVELELLATLQACSGLINGVTQLNDRIYALCRESDTIRVFNADAPYEPLDSFTIPGLSNPQDLAACVSTNALYVINLEPDNTVTVWKANLPELEWTLWMHGSFRPGTMSVTSDGRVLILGFQNLYVYDSDSNLIDNITLSDVVVDPRHAVMTTNDNYVVSYLAQSRNNISEVNRGGSVVQSYSGELSSGYGGLNVPSHLAVDDLGRVFVADYWNWRVLVLESDLSRGDELLTYGDDDVVLPYRLNYDAESRLLLVGLNSDPVPEDVLVYKVTY